VDLSRKSFKLKQSDNYFPEDNKENNINEANSEIQRIAYIFVIDITSDEKAFKDTEVLIDKLYHIEKNSMLSEKVVIFNKLGIIITLTYRYLS
jgi:hypothetical protein